MQQGHIFRCSEFIRCFFGVSPCSGTSWFKEYTSQISMSNTSFLVSEESLGSFGVESLSLTLPIFHESFLLIPGFFSLKTKKYLHRHPADS